jgi:peptide deformylase
MPNVRISYYDENWKHHEESYSGLAARIIQHEYDHIEGKLFTDKLNPLRKRLIEKKLADISKGNVSVDYKMKFPAAKKGR